MQIQFAADELFYFLLSVGRRISSRSDGHDPPGIAPSASGGQNPLLPLPASGDNAAMEAEPTKADPPKRKRRWFQFSLRTLLILVTLLCAAMAIVSNDASRQKSATERIKAAHGLVFYDYQLDAAFRPRTDDPVPPGPDWLRNLIGVDYFATTVMVGVNVGSDEFLQAAADLPHLRNLRIACDSKISDRAWERLKGLSELETLYVRGIRDTGMANLSGLTRLRTLSVTQTDVTDAGLVYLKDLTQLEELNLTATKVTDAGLENLMGFTQLRILHVTATPVTAAGVKRIRTAFPRCKIYR